MPTREECIKDMGQLFAQARVDVLALTPREQAEAAWTPTSTYASVDALEDQIRVRRGLAPIHNAQTA